PVIGLVLEILLVQEAIAAGPGASGPPGTRGLNHALDHAMFVALMTNALFGPMLVLTPHAPPRAAWADHVIAWRPNAGVASCIAGEPEKAVTFGDVLLLADGDAVKDAAKATVRGEIVGHGKGEKIIVYRYKNKTRSRKRTGHGSKTTTVKIKKIEAK